LKTIRNVYISGLGAVGAAYASKLYDMDPECIRVIADSERIKRYRQSGFIINGKPYSFQYISPEEEAPPADLIIVAVKHHHLEQAIRDMHKFVGKATVILSLLNGIVSEERIGSAYGIEKMLYAMCVGIDAVREGTVTTFSSGGRIVFGESTNTSLSPRVAAVRELFDNAGITCVIPENMLRSLWWKFMMNVGVNQASAILRAPYGIFFKMPEAMELMRSASREVVQLSAKAGIHLTESDIDEFVNILKGLSPDGKTSMLQDMEAGRKTEVEIFSGTVIELGKKYGVATPVNETLYRIIRTMEQR
jgi:2-dehydropantoate 2-reductase